MAIASALQMKGLFVYASKGFTLGCRIKILHQPFLFNHVDETPYLLEANVRLGDPEAEVILPRLKTPLSDISFQIISGVLGEKKVEWSQDYYYDVVAAAGRTQQVRHGKNKGWYPGYPARYGKGHCL